MRYSRYGNRWAVSARLSFGVIRTRDPLSLDEAIEVVDYDPRWSDRYRSDAAELDVALGARIGGVEHFGSTSVPGMSAKPIIDVLVGLARWPMLDRDREALESLGYEYLGEAGVAGREYFRRRATHDTNVALVEWKGPVWQDDLMLRDYLRANPSIAATYSQAKREAWRGGARTLLAYSTVKAAKMAELVERARRWSAG
jgi:GrpB-like predicted nucleotidyltransferase (UPF0157 family)